MGLDAQASRRAVLGAGIAVTAAACSASGKDKDTAPGTVLGKTSEVPVGGAKIFEKDKVIVTQLTAGQFKGYTAICPHEQCTVNQIKGDKLVCPCHQSQFNVADGSVLPDQSARTGLKEMPVTVSGENISLA